MLNGDWVLYHNMKYNTTGIWTEKEIIAPTTSEYRGLMDAKVDAEKRIHLVWTDINGIKYRRYDNGSWNSISLVGYGDHPCLQLNTLQAANIL